MANEKDKETKNNPKLSDEEVFEGEVEQKTSRLDDEEKPNLQIYQHFADYTERPDILIDALEKHDKGFVKKLNRITLDDLEKDKNDRFLFSKRQAYISLGISSIAAIALLGLAFYMVFKGIIGFLPFLGLAVFYAVTQSGFEGLGAIAAALAKAVLKVTGKENKD